MNGLRLSGSLTQPTRSVTLPAGGEADGEARAAEKPVARPAASRQKATKAASCTGRHRRVLPGVLRYESGMAIPPGCRGPARAVSRYQPSQVVTGERPGGTPRGRET